MLNAFESASGNLAQGSWFENMKRRWRLCATGGVMVPSARVSGVNHGSGQESAVGGPPKAGVHGLMHI